MLKRLLEWANSEARRDASLSGGCAGVHLLLLLLLLLLLVQKVLLLLLLLFVPVLRCGRRGSRGSRRVATGAVGRLCPLLRRCQKPLQFTLV